MNIIKCGQIYVNLALSQILATDSVRPGKKQKKISLRTSRPHADLTKKWAAITHTSKNRSVDSWVILWTLLKEPAGVLATAKYHTCSQKEPIQRELSKANSEIKMIRVARLIWHSRPLKNIPVTGIRPFQGRWSDARGCSSIFRDRGTTLPKYFWRPWFSPEIYMLSYLKSSILTMSC